MSMKYVIWGIIGFVVLLGGCNGISYKNDMQKLENLAYGQTDMCKLTYKKTADIVSQKAQVATEASGQFKDIYVKLMEARYGHEDQVVFKWIKEQNPNFDMSMYKDLSRSIESLREEFFTQQKTLRDIKLQHDNLRTLFPGSIWAAVFGIKELKVQLILSAQTNEVYRTGEENNVDVFQKNK